MSSSLSLSPLVAVAAVVIVLATVIAAVKRPQTRKRAAPLRTASPLTKREQPMYFRLVEAFPEHVVLAQVAFSALLRSKDRATRNVFDRKVADFVVCSKSFAVLAVIELDDSSHDGRAHEDSARASLLTDVGYRVLRYRQVPDALRLRADLQTEPVLGETRTSGTPADALRTEPVIGNVAAAELMPRPRSRQ